MQTLLRSIRFRTVNANTAFNTVLNITLTDLRTTRVILSLSRLMSDSLVVSFEMDPPKRLDLSRVSFLIHRIDSMKELRFGACPLAKITG